MTKEDARKIIQDVLDQLSLKKKDREILEQALSVLAQPESVQPVS